jgi:hypothetical protein
MTMGRPQPITTKPGRRAGEYVVQVPAGWELRLRRVLKQLLKETLPDPREPGLSPAQREARILIRRKRVQAAVCQFISDLVTADLVGKEVALSTRNRYGTRRGSLREHVHAILKEAAEQ